MSAQTPIADIESNGGDSSLPRHFLRAALHIALTSGRSHGYELVEQVKLFGLATVDLAGIYRSLKSMEHDGLLSSEWENSELGPPRRVYELTSLGHRATDHHRSALRTARDHLDVLLRFAPSGDAQTAMPVSGHPIR